MKRLCLLPLLILVCFYSCKSPLENIDINNIEKHRAYQDSCINTTKDPIEQLKVTETLISEYRKMKIDEKKPNANYYYYLARLYSGVNDQSIYENCFFDKANNSIKNTTQFKNYYDSTYYFSEKCLSIDANNIKCATILAQTFFMEFARFMQTDRKNISNFPSVANEELLNKRFDYIINNTNRFIGIDTSTNKESSRRFTEVSLQFLDKFKLSKGLKFVANDINTTNILILAGNFIDYLSKFDKPFFVLKLSKQYLNEISQKYMPEISLAREELRKREVKNKLLNGIKQLGIKHKYSTFDSETGVGGLLDLWTDNDFTHSVSNGFGTYSGRGSWTGNEGSICFHRTSGIALDGCVEVSIYNNERVVLRLNTGAVYVQDDDGELLKKRINTNGYWSSIESQCLSKSFIVEKPSNMGQNQIGFYLADGNEANKICIYDSNIVTSKVKEYINTQKMVQVQKIENGFGYIEFMNSDNRENYGWVEMKNLLLMKEK